MGENKATCSRTVYGVWEGVEMFGIFWQERDWKKVNGPTGPARRAQAFLARECDEPFVEKK
jgi:hypothetical protein